jgi:ATP-dependent RNA helicase SUPV3L1/SUV3
MIGDEQRGFAWTRALLGLPANEIHVCGDTSAVALVRQLAEECGDEFELRVGRVGWGWCGAGAADWAVGV